MFLDGLYLDFHMNSQLSTLIPFPWHLAWDFVRGFGFHFQTLRSGRYLEKKIVT